MGDLKETPQAIRQGAAAALTVAAVAAAMPAISYRAAEQRDDSLWAARVNLVQEALAEGAAAAPQNEARVVLTSFAQENGWRAETAAAGEFGPDALGRDAMRISARVAETTALASAAPASADIAGARVSLQEAHCLAEAIYYEARSESYLGQLAVAEVVVNRVKSKHYPGTYCDVVYQGSYRATGCQFTFTCDGSLRHRPKGIAWVRANVLASQVIAGVVRPVTHRATHYHTDAVDPVWSASLVETTRIGAHIFYRFPNKRERVALQEAALRAAEAPPAAAETAEAKLQAVSLTTEAPAAKPPVDA